jgi:hypothetical protein
MTDITLFAGPSGFGIDLTGLAFPGLQLCPPVGRGDIDKLVRSSQTRGVIIICDGVFECQPAVSHKEICLALDQGWQVWGVSSIGAIRACEMMEQGMRGFGHVFRMFCQDADFCDDEACLLYFPEAPWFPVSEPLVNVRHALANAAPQWGILPEHGERLIAWLRGLWFGERTMEAMRNFMAAELGISKAAIDAFFAWLETNRVKAIDLQNILIERPWE